MNRSFVAFAVLLLTPPVAFPAADGAIKKAGPRVARPALPDGVEKREVTIFSDGVRMSGDLYLPKELAPDDKRPAIVICAGTGGTKQSSGNRVGPIFAQQGYIVLAFDYRGWGASDSKLITTEKQPRPDAKGEVTVTARAVRWQMDFADQTADIRAALSFVAGEPHVDSTRLALWGTSYGGGLVTWVAGNDPRVKGTIAQVPGMGAGRGPAAIARAYEQLTKQSRGEIEPVPFETGQLGAKLAAYPQMRSNPPKAIGYSVVEAAEKIKTPVLIIEAAEDELSKPADNGQRVAAILRSHGTPVEYHVIAGMTHYGVYQGHFQEVTDLELAWLKQNLPVRTPASSLVPH